MTTPVGGRRVAALLSVLLSVLLGLLAGCGGTESPKSPRAEASADAPDKPPTKGTCWDDDQLADALGPEEFDAWVEKYASGDSALGDSMRDDVAFSKEIECTAPHSLELYNVIELAPALIAQVKGYADLLDQKSELYRKIRDQVNNRCLSGSPYGKAQAKAGGIPVQLSPALSTGSGLHLAWDPYPADLWAKDEKKFVCTFEQDEPGTLRFADFTTRKVPVAARVCLNTPRKYVPCRGRHDAELVAGMTLNTAIERGEISGRKAVRKGPKGPYVALSDAQYAKLDKICQAFLSSVSTVRGGVEARAYPGSVSQWPTDTGAYVASCFALKPYTPPPPITGTVFNKP